MLYPRSNEVRSVIDLSGIWEFCLGDQNGPGEICETFSQGELIAVPASYNDQKDDPAYRGHYGWAYYRRKVTVPSCWKGQRVLLRFDAVTHGARIYLNHILVKEHEGGFLPFELDVTEQIPAGSSAELMVAVDNRVNHSTLPVGNEGSTAFFGSDNPGVPSVEAAKQWRRPQNLPNFDFFNYAGINRPVRLYTTPREYIEDITLVPDIAGTDGIVNYQVSVGGNHNDGQEADQREDFALPQIKVEIVDKEGRVVACGEGESGKIVIPEAKLWRPWPGTPYLYTAVITYGEDHYEQTFGIRTVKVEGTKFLINGEPFYFKGFGKHEDSAFHGRGLDLCLDVKDINLIHWLNANSFRTSHYPYAEEMYDLCDREGIVVIDETPAVGINGSGNFNPYEVFSVRAHHEQVLRSW